MNYIGAETSGVMMFVVSSVKIQEFLRKLFGGQAHNQVSINRFS
jgi:hypothetical protein